MMAGSEPRGGCPDSEEFVATGRTRPPKFGGRAREIVPGNVGDICRASDGPDRTLEVLRQLAGSLNALYKATVLYRLLLGQQLVIIQANEYWRKIERRDYRNDPLGTPLWISERDRTYVSWYNFIEEGFEHITGLTRQTAYSAIKLAMSPGLAALPAEDLRKFKRLANALELVAAERRGIKITPELLAQAQEMTIENFRRTARFLGSTGTAPKKVFVLPEIVKFLKPLAVSNPKIVDSFWAAIRQALDSAGHSEDPLKALQEVTERIKGVKA